MAVTYPAQIGLPQPCQERGFQYCFPFFGANLLYCLDLSILPVKHHLSKLSMPHGLGQHVSCRAARDSQELALELAGISFGNKGKGTRCPWPAH